MKKMGESFEAFGEKLQAYRPSKETQMWSDALMMLCYDGLDILRIPGAIIVARLAQEIGTLTEIMLSNQKDLTYEQIEAAIRANIEVGRSNYVEAAAAQELEKRRNRK